MVLQTFQVRIWAGGCLVLPAPIGSDDISSVHRPSPAHCIIAHPTAAKNHLTHHPHRGLVCEVDIDRLLSRSCIYSGGVAATASPHQHTPHLHLTCVCLTFTFWGSSNFTKTFLCVSDLCTAIKMCHRSQGKTLMLMFKSAAKVAFI